MKKLLYILFSFLPSFAFAQDGDKSVDKVQLIDSLYADFIGLEVQDLYDSAYVVLKKCYELDPEAAELNYQMALYDRMYAREDSTQAGEDAMTGVMEKLRKAYEKEPDNKKYVVTLLNASAETGDTTLVQPLLEHIVELDRTNEQYIYVLLRLYESKEEYEKELNLLNRLEEVTGSSTGIEMYRFDALRKTKGDKAALKYLNNLIKKSPQESQYYAALAYYYEEKENFKKAIPQYEKAMQLDPSEPNYQYSYIGCLEKMGNDAEARQQKLAIINNPKSSSELKVQLVRDLLEEFETEENGTERMMQMFRTALKQPQETTDLTQLYIGYMGMQKYSHDSIANALKDVLAIEPTNEDAYLFLLNYYESIDEKKLLAETCQQAIDNGVDKLEFYFYQGIYYYQLDDKDKALQAFQNAVANRKFANNPKLYAECYSLIGSIYHEKDSLEKAFEAYEECLKWDADNIETLNNYAYYLSVEGKDLERAEKMSKRTIIAEPNKGIYLDTYAWILYMMGRYDEAATYINKAIADTGNVSAEEYEHAGDIYYKLNEKEAAVAYWELALMKAEQEEGYDKAELERKIKTKKL